MSVCWYSRRISAPSSTVWMPMPSSGSNPCHRPTKSRSASSGSHRSIGSVFGFPAKHASAAEDREFVADPERTDHGELDHGPSTLTCCASSRNPGDSIGRIGGKRSAAELGTADAGRLRTPGTCSGPSHRTGHSRSGLRPYGPPAVSATTRYSKLPLDSVSELIFMPRRKPENSSAKHGRCKRSRKPKNSENHCLTHVDFPPG